MSVVFSKSYVETAEGVGRSWAAHSCPRCGGVTLVELNITDARGHTVGPSMAIGNNAEVVEVQVLPSDEHQRYHVDHLPEDVAAYLSGAIRILDAGVPDGSAVQLRKTLEAAAAHRGIRERSLVSSIEKLVEEGMITRDFGKAVHHIRKVGNIGAHYTDERISQPEAEQALRFTVEVLRNLLEVPGELEKIQAAAQSSDEDRDS
jgi:hypothetical protein